MERRVTAEKVVCMNCAGRRADGFTLVEILVVLAILVILFSLIIIPLISGLDMASRGRSALQLHDAARSALEQLRSDLQDAVYVYPTEMVLDPSIPPADPPQYRANSSKVVFVPPARGAGGQVAEPLRFATIQDWAPLPGQPTVVQRAICLGVLPALLTTPATPYNEDNPFVLFRMQGKCLYDPDSGLAAFEELPGSGREALTPKTGFDILPAWWMVADPSSTYYGDVGTQYPTPGDARYNETLLCGFKGFHVKAKRVVGEEMVLDSSSLVYRASRQMWDGRPIVYTVDLAGNPDPLAGQLRELDPLDYVHPAIDPRIVVLRFTSDADQSPLPSPLPDPRGGRHTQIVYDSFDPALRDPDLALRYDLTNGEVLFGQVNAASRSLPLLPPPAESEVDPDADGVPNPGVHPLPFRDFNMDGGLDEVSVNGAWAFAVVPPQSPAHLTKILPDDVRVWVQLRGDVGYTEYTPTEEKDPDEIGMTQFSARPLARSGYLELRFNRHRFALDPDDRVTYQSVRVEYVHRRNFARVDMQVLDPTGASGREVFDVDDKVIVDYSTRETLVVMLELSEVISQDDPSLPPTQVVQSARLTAEINLDNLGA